MDFVLVFPLILAFLCTGLCNANMTSVVCYKMCPPGYHKDGECDDPGQSGELPHTCKKCEENSYTAKHNNHRRCIRCTLCGHHQIQIQPCNTTSDVKCDCKERYYNAYASTGNENGLDCQSCLCKNCNPSGNPDYKKKCQSCQRCLNNTECKRKCATTAVPPSTTPPTTTTTSRDPSPAPSTFMTVTAPGTTPSNNTSNPAFIPIHPNSMNQMPWLLLVGVMVTFLVFLWLLLFFTRNPLRYPDSCLCWRANKDLEPPVENHIFNEQRSHQGSGLTTLTLNISEDTPMMPLSQSPATPEHPAHVGPVLPDAGHRAARQDEQSEHWPAIVLYAIIKEVPLRRWKEFLRLLSVTDRHMERVELETSLGLGSMERQYQMLRLWSQRSSASLNDVFSALHYMDLSGCAQLLQESLEKLQWGPDLKQGFTHHGFNGVMQYT